MKDDFESALCTKNEAINNEIVNLVDYVILSEFIHA